MKSPLPDGPPRLGRALVRWRAPMERCAELEGDVVESWRARKLAGRAYRLPFWRDVWSIVKPRMSAEIRTAFGQGVSGMKDDVRFAVRLLRRQPAFSALIITTLAFGIAASTAAFTVCDRVLFKPLPYPEPHRIVSLPPIGFSFAGGHMGVSKSVQALPVFSSVGLYASGGLNLGNETQPARVRAAAVSDGFFPVLGVPALMGRTIDAAESRDAAKVALLSRAAWRSYFQSAPDIVGRTIRINSRPFQVVGVMPAGFSFPQDSEVWIPSGSDDQISGEAFAPSLVGRLAASASAADAAAALAPRNEGKPARVKPLQQELVGKVRPTLLFVGAIAGLLLLATCANVAGLLLSRVSARARELAVRASLGASPLRLSRQLATECFFLTVLGTVGGFMLAVWMVRLLPSVAPSFVPDVDLVAIDVRFLGVAAVVTLITAALFAVVPAIAAFRSQSRRAERGSRATTARAGWVPTALLAGQVAAALVLLTATSAALSVVSRLTRVDIGFSNQNAAIFELTLPLERYTGPAVANFVDRLESRLAAVPGVARVGTTNRGPGSKTVGAGSPISDADAPLPVSESTTDMLSRSAERLNATPGYFEAMGIRIVAGRAFSTNDRIGATPVAIVNTTVARQFWGDPGSAVGRRIRMTLSRQRASILEVVGVVDDARLRGVSAEAGRQVYVPLAQMPPFGLITVAVEARSGDPAALMPALRAALKEVDAEVPAHDIVLSSELISRFLASQRLTLWLSSGFALLALGLCAIGLYGALSQVVAQRTREIGIRMALGASRHRLSGGVVWQSLRVAMVGVIAGGFASGLASRVIARFVPALDPPSAAAVTGAAFVLLTVATLAAWAPARRASSVDPLRALRND